MPQSRSTVIVAGQSLPAKINKLDRLQLTAWALLRGRQGQALGPSSLANGGQLGGSQAGARLTYNFTRQIAASLRSTSDVARRGGEVAAGVRLQPVLGIPVWVTAERRQRIGRYGSGRNALPCSSKAGSISGRCRGISASMPICRAGSSGFTGATASSMVG